VQNRGIEKSETCYLKPLIPHEFECCPVADSAFKNDQLWHDKADLKRSTK